MTPLTFTIVVILSLLWGIGSFIQLLGTWVSLLSNSRDVSGKRPIYWEPISILKPLKGVDAELETNLNSFFEIDYPAFELLFCLASFEDPAYPVVKKLLENHPQVSAKLIVQPVDLGPNPKVNNMMRSYELAQNDLILISDSNVRVPADYLKKLSNSARDKKVGMVTAVISGFESEGMGGKLESIFLNTFYARWMRLLFFIGRPCVVGKCMLFRKSVAKRFGGIGVLARYLAEDYMAGEAVKRLGLKVVLAREPVKQCIGKLTLKQFWSRHIRWGRIRKSQVFLAFLIEPFLGSVVSGGLGATAFNLIYHFNPIDFFGLHMLGWFLLELPLFWQSQEKVGFLDFIFWLMREFLAFPLWLNIALGNTVHWRGKNLTLEPGGLLATNEPGIAI